MYDHGLRGFLIAFISVFILTFQGCSSIVVPKFALIFSITLAAIAGVVGLVVGKQFKHDNETRETLFIQKYQKYIFASSILAAALVIWFIKNPDMFSNEPSQKLKGNLKNLNGTWAWVSKKSEATYYIGICFDLYARSGDYELISLSDNWESQKKSKISRIRKGKFKLINGYDRYGDKAYVGKDIGTENPMFVITLLDNDYASEWHLRLKMVEDDMFGQGMLKINDNCDSISK